MGFFIKILLPTIGTLLLFVRFAECKTDVIAERTSSSLEIGANRSNVTSTFFNIDRKKNGDQDYSYEHLDDVDTMLKSKTDILSRRLKIDIDRLRNKTDQVDRGRIDLMCLFLSCLSSTKQVRKVYKYLKGCQSRWQA